MSPIGLILIIASALIPAWLFVTLPDVALSGALFSQYLGVLALILMAWAQIMATRLPGVEAIMGPIDRVYVLHKWTGIIAMLAILLHDTIDAEMRGMGRDTVLSELAETLGELSLYGLLILVVISVATFVPYHLWKWTHKAMGGFFIAGFFHYFFILKPFEESSPLGLYVTVFCLVGVAAYVFTLLPNALRPTYRYEVSALRKTGGATEITMTPKKRSLKAQPGQFAVFSFGAPGLAEPHPYSLSAPAGADGSLQITVKPLGDYTYRLARDLENGADVNVQGPFGRFTRRTPKAKAEIWVAGGIGITPFLAWAEALETNPDAPVHLFWSIRNRDEAPQLDRIEAIAASFSNLTLHLMDSSQGERLTPEHIADAAGGPMKIWFCGPAGLRRALIKGLGLHGVSARDFHFEEFEFRTGVGLKRLAAWIARRLQARLMTSE